MWNVQYSCGVISRQVAAQKRSPTRAGMVDGILDRLVHTESDVEHERVTNIHLSTDTHLRELRLRYKREQADHEEPDGLCAS